MMRFLELFSLLIFNGRAVNGPPGSLELVGADVGPMLVLSPRDGYQDMVLGFEIVSSDAKVEAIKPTRTGMPNGLGQCSC